MYRILIYDNYSIIHVLAIPYTDNSIRQHCVAGPITMEAVVTAQPWANTIDVVTLPGKALKEVLEHSVSQYDASHPDPGGRFLQLSGLIVKYNEAAPTGSRLVQVKVGQPDDQAGWSDVDDDALYEVAMSSFMVKGGDGYQMIPDNLREHRNTGFLDNDLFVSYLKKNDPLTLPSEGRIKIVSQEYTADGMAIMPSFSGVSLLSLILSICAL